MHTYGYLFTMGAWVVFPRGEDPETSYVFITDSADEAEQHANKLNTEPRHETTN